MMKPVTANFVHETVNSHMSNRTQGKSPTNYLIVVTQQTTVPMTAQSCALFLSLFMLILIFGSLHFSPLQSHYAIMLIFID